MNEKALLNHLFHRYKNVMVSARLNGYRDIHAQNQKLSIANLLWMARTVIETEDFPSEKANRWLGFVQGCLAMRGLVDVDEEREYTRELFHEVYGEYKTLGRCE